MRHDEARKPFDSMFTNAVIKVGDGRGFVIEQRISTAVLKSKLTGRIRLRPFVERRLVVTAAHCLPHFPPCHGASLLEERTYGLLLGTLDAPKRRKVWAECLFVDPVADIAVLGCPDTQALGNEADKYELLIEGASVLRIGNAKSGLGWVLSLDRQWISTRLEVVSTVGGTSLFIDPTESGQSGSPILNNTGRAIGVVALGSETLDLRSREHIHERTGPQPMLTRNLPGWLL
jgi:hypothetical protein